MQLLHKIKSIALNVLSKVILENGKRVTENLGLLLKLYKSFRLESREHTKSMGKVYIELYCSVGEKRILGIFIILVGL